MVFEPSRVAAACLADAYARVVPVRRRVLGTARAAQYASAAQPERSTAPTIGTPSLRDHRRAAGTGR